MPTDEYFTKKLIACMHLENRKGELSGDKGFVLNLILSAKWNVCSKVTFFWIYFPEERLLTETCRASLTGAIQHDGVLCQHAGCS